MKAGFKLFIYLSIAFFFAVIGGTLFHEAGHYTAARSFGYSASISHDVTHYQYTPEIRAMLDSTMNDTVPLQVRVHKYKALVDRLNSQSIMIGLGGPLANMGLGTLAFILLCISFRKRYVSSWYGWLLVFLTFFWSRQVLNFIGFLFILPGGDVHRILRGDEAHVSALLGLPAYMLGLITCVAGAAILLYVLFKFIRKEERLLFLGAGVFGGGLGVLIWFFLLGPVLLP